MAFFLFRKNFLRISIFDNFMILKILKIVQKRTYLSDIRSFRPKYKYWGGYKTSLESIILSLEISIENWKFNFEIGNSTIDLKTSLLTWKHCIFGYNFLYLNKFAGFQVNSEFFIADVCNFEMKFPT